MSEDKAEKVVPGGTGCQGCGCLLVIIAVIAAFVAGVAYSEQAREKWEDVRGRFGSDVEDKIETIKDTVKEKVQ